MRTLEELKLELLERATEYSSLEALYKYRKTFSHDKEAMRLRLNLRLVARAIHELESQITALSQVQPEEFEW